MARAATEVSAECFAAHGRVPAVLMGRGRRHTLRKADQLPLWAACAFCCAAVSAMLSAFCVQGRARRDALGMSPGFLVYAAEGLPAV